LGNPNRLYASWNGATEVAHWQLLEGPSASTVSPRSTTPKQGFETVLATTAKARYATAVALDRHGGVLGRSVALQLIP
jgi:hypothetical protein